MVCRIEGIQLGINVEQHPWSLMLLDDSFKISVIDLHRAVKRIERRSIKEGLVIGVMQFSAVGEGVQLRDEVFGGKALRMKDAV